MRIDRAVAPGTLHRLTIESKAVADNLLGDSPLRTVHVYTPAGWNGGDPLPLLVDLVGFTGSGHSHISWRNFSENVPERLDRLIGHGEMPPVAVAFPDCFTRLGGNQYVNSPAMGRWEDFLIDEMLPAVESKFRCGGPGRRGVFGKSSGGFGAITHAMRRADTWSAAACHSGDMGFDWVFLPMFPDTLRALDKHGSSAQRFVERFEESPKNSMDDVHALMVLAMGATYDPDPDAFCGIRLPVDLRTCELDAQRWNNWLAWDPLCCVDQYADNLRSLRGLFIDCGTTDQYNLVYGARQMHSALERLGVDHTYEEFIDDHTNVDYRMDHSLPFLARALS